MFLELWIGNIHSHGTLLRWGIIEIETAPVILYQVEAIVSIDTRWGSVHRSEHKYARGVCSNTTLSVSLFKKLHEGADQGTGSGTRLSCSAAGRARGNQRWGCSITGWPRSKQMEQDV